IEIEQFAKLFLQEFLERFLLWQQRVQRSVQTIIIDFLVRYTEQVRQRAGLVEVLGQVQFAGRFTQPAENQNHGHCRPRNFLASIRQSLFQEAIQFQPAQQRSSQPRATEFPAAFHAHALNIDFHPSWFRGAEQARLITRALLGAALHSQTAPLVHDSQPRYDALPGASIGSVTLHQSPVGVAFAVFAPIAASQIHTAMLRIAETKSRGLVVTTRTFQASNAGIRKTGTQTKALSAASSA